MKYLGSIFILVLATALSAQDKPSTTKTFTRNSAPGVGYSHGPSTRGGGGLGPTTWGFCSYYTGTLYGTGYYAFDVNATGGGYNSVSGNEFNYPASGFVAEIRAVFVFDVSSLLGTTSPTWSAFMFDVSDPPPVGTARPTTFFDFAIESSSGFSLVGNADFGGPVTTLDIYDAEDFERSNALETPHLAFSGVNPFLTSIPITTGTQPIAIDVTAAVVDDDPSGTPGSPVPVLGPVGLGVFALLLLAGGLVYMRRQRATS